MRFRRREVRSAEISQRLALLGAFSVISLLLLGLHLAGVQLCLFNRLTGLPCVTCGASRAALCLLRCSFSEAFRIQPLLTLLMIGCGVYFVWTSFWMFCRREVVVVEITRKERLILLTVLCSAALLNWIYLLLVTD